MLNDMFNSQRDVYHYYFDVIMLVYKRKVKTIMRKHFSFLMMKTISQSKINRN